MTIPRRNGGISHWMARRARTPRPSLNGSTNADVCVVGAGFTGLWTAYHLLQRSPGLRVVVVESEHVGYGASGRNAGWLSAQAPGNRRAFARSAGSRQAGVDVQRAMVAAVDDVLDVIEREGIDASALRSGNLVIARTPAAMERLRARRRSDLAWGMAEDEVHELDADAARARIDAAGSIGGLYYPVVGRIDPAGLVVGLAELLEGRGVRIYERSAVERIEDGVVVTADGEVRARSALRCTEAYTGGFGVDPRRIIPVNSSIIITDPVPTRVWDQIGWSGFECFSDAAHVSSYAQRTDDGRILIGGRGNPYRFGSRVSVDGRVDDATLAALAGRLHSIFPQVADVPIAHAWSGVIGVTRDWCASVRYDADSGIGWAQGYAGHGVTSAYLAAASLAALVQGADDDVARLAWVGRRSRRWEPEPARWLGVHGMYRLFAAADALEERRQSTTTSALARVGARLAGLHD